VLPGGKRRAIQGKVATQLPRILTGLILIALTVIIHGCADEPQRGHPSDRARDRRPDQEIEQFVLEETVQGKTQWILRARWAAIYERDELVRLTGVAIDFLDEEGNISSTLTSDRGMLQRVISSMEAHGHVTVVSRDSVILRTEQLYYSGENNRITTESYVEIARGGDIVTGYGLESDPDLRHFEIKRRVKGRIQGEAEDL
jgi:LPS export ABC transporter protein LptC